HATSHDCHPEQTCLLNMIVRHSKRRRGHAVGLVGLNAPLPLGSAFSTRRCENGTVLFVTMLITGIVGVLMLSYLSMIQTQNFSVSRAQAWNKAIVVAEAGVEEAMAHLNSSGVSLGNLAINSWATNGASTVFKTNLVGDSYSYVTITATSSFPVIVSAAYVPGPISSPQLSRTVQVNCKPKPGGGAA